MLRPQSMASESAYDQMVTLPKNLQCWLSASDWLLGASNKAWDRWCWGASLSPSYFSHCWEIELACDQSRPGLQDSV